MDFTEEKDGNLVWKGYNMPIHYVSDSNRVFVD
jgi:hypothetical protein